MKTRFLILFSVFTLVIALFGPSPAVASRNTDLVAESLTFNTETGRSTLVIKFVGTGNWRKEMTNFIGSSGFARIQWINDSSVVIRTDDIFYGRYLRKQSIGNNDWNFYYEYSPPPSGASRYEVWLDDNVFLESPENNRLLGSVPPLSSATPTPSPLSTPSPTPVPEDEEETLWEKLIKSATGIVSTIKLVVPSPNPSPTPTSTDETTTSSTDKKASSNRDLIAESLTFNTTGKSSLFVKLVSPTRAKKVLIDVVEGGEQIRVQWFNDAGAVMREDYVLYRRYARMEPVENGWNLYYEYFDPPPTGASRYEVFISDDVFFEPSDNNRLAGTVPTDLTATPTVTPSPTPTVTPANTLLSSITPSTSSGATKVFNLQYPIEELGNCKDKEDCKKYCDLDENFNACNEWAVKQGLRTREEAERLRNARNVKSGPGGCNSQENCASYCDKPENLNVCLEYAEKNNLMSADELDKTKKVLKVISSGSKTPGDCKTPKACKSYCTGGEHVNECLEFGKAAGVLSEDETKKGKDLLENGGPGGCKTKEQCEAYCDEDVHEEECDAFMEKMGVPDRKAKDKSGKPPKTGGGAVCSTQEECEAFCKNPANAESCKNVVMKGGKKTGPEITGDTGKLRGDIERMLPQAQVCVKKALGEEVFNRIMSGETLEKPISGDAFASCSEEGKKEYEEEEMRKKPKKKDDFSTGYGPGPGYRYNSAGEVEKIPQDTQTGPGGVPEEIPGQSGEAGGVPEEVPQGDQANPGGVPEVQGVSTMRSLLNAILDWFRR